jgi:hypothetical protein
MNNRPILSAVALIAGFAVFVPASAVDAVRPIISMPESNYFFGSGASVTKLGTGYTGVEVGGLGCSGTLTPPDASNNVSFIESVRLQFRRPDTLALLTTLNFSTVFAGIPAASQFVSAPCMGTNASDGAWFSIGIGQAGASTKVLVVINRADVSYSNPTTHVVTSLRKYLVGAYSFAGVSRWVPLVFASPDATGAQIIHGISGVGDFLNDDGIDEIRIVTERGIAPSATYPKGAVQYLWRFYSLDNKVLITQKAFVVANP